jgi:hypothetical protein
MLVLAGCGGGAFSSKIPGTESLTLSPSQTNRLERLLDDYGRDDPILNTVAACVAIHYDKWEANPFKNSERDLAIGQIQECAERSNLEVRCQEAVDGTGPICGRRGERIGYSLASVFGWMAAGEPATKVDENVESESSSTSAPQPVVKNTPSKLVMLKASQDELLDCARTMSKCNYINSKYETLPQGQSSYDVSLEDLAAKLDKIDPDFVCENGQFPFTALCVADRGFDGEKIVELHYSDKSAFAAAKDMFNTPYDLVACMGDGFVAQFATPLNEVPNFSKDLAKVMRCVVYPN